MSRPLAKLALAGEIDDFSADFCAERESHTQRVGDEQGQKSAKKGDLNGRMELCKRSSDLFIVAGEPSGDLQGAKLIQSLLHFRPHLSISAVAGPRMRECPIDVPFRMENLQVMGFIDVLLALPQICRQFFAIRNHILKLSPKAVICIDYPGFNLRLEKSLRKKGYQGKLIHFVCPTVWAWGKKRIPLMEQNLDLLLTLFPFEKACFSQTQLPVKYVGHPLASSIASFLPSKTFRAKYHIRPEQKILGLFPGSRTSEIEKNFSLQIETARRLLALDPTLCIAISISRTELEASIRQKTQINAVFIPGADTYDLMRASHLAIATSGTVTLELALHGTPTVVNFAIRPLDCFIAQKIFHINLPFYCIANIILGQTVFPELFGPHLTQESLFYWSHKLLCDTALRETCTQRCQDVRKSLGVNDSAKDAAEEILKLVAF